jgi:hypothetical protein
MTMHLTTREMIALAKPDETVRRVQLVPKAALSLPRRNQLIRVIAGTAWTVLDGQDIVLNQGEKINLWPGEYDALISPLGGSLLIIEIDTQN